MENAREVIGFIGMIMGLFLYLSPVTTFIRIVKKRPTGQLSATPFVMPWLGCAGFMWYGLASIPHDNAQMVIANAICFSIYSIYLIIFLFVAFEKRDMKYLTTMVVISASFLSYAVCSLHFFHGNDRKLFCGIVAAILSTIMYGSHLKTVRLVKQTKSVKSMPFFSSLIRFLYGMSWFGFGLLQKDTFVTIPNGFGCGVGALQLMVYAFYCNNKGETNNDKGKTISDKGKKTHKKKRKTKTK